MLRPYRGISEKPQRDFSPSFGWVRNDGQRRKAAATKRRCELFLAGSGAGEELVHADDLAVQRAGNQRFALDFAGLGIRDGNVVDLQSSANGSLIAGLSFLQVGQGTNLVPLCGDEVALRLNDQVNCGGAKLILLLLGVEGLLLELASLARGGDLRAVLGQRDVGFAHVGKGGVSQLLHLRFELPLHKESAGMKSLGRTVAQGKGQGQLAGVLREAIMK